MRCFGNELQLHGLLKGLCVGDDTLGACVGLIARARHLVVYTHLDGDLKLVVGVDDFSVVVVVVCRLWLGMVTVVVAVLGMAVVNVLVAEELVEFVLGCGGSHFERKRGLGGGDYMVWWKEAESC